MGAFKLNFDLTLFKQITAGMTPAEIAQLLREKTPLFFSESEVRSWLAGDSEPRYATYVAQALGVKPSVMFPSEPRKEA